MPSRTPRIVAGFPSAAPVLLAVALSCSGGDATSPSMLQSTPPQGQPPVSTIVVQATSTTALMPGGSMLFAATPEDASGKPVAGLTITWKSSDTSIATVAGLGVATAEVTAVAPGSATITASTGGASGASIVTVTKPVVPYMVSIRPDSANFVEGPQGFGAPLQLTAILADSSGGAVFGPVAWSSSDTTGAGVSATGLLTPSPSVLRTTIVTITANSGGTRGTATIVVNPVVGAISISPVTPSVSVGGSVVLHAAVEDTHGNPLTGVPLGWTNFNANLVRLERYGDSVTVVAMSPGVARIGTAELMSGTTASVFVTVTSALSDARLGPPARVAREADRLPPRLGRDRAQFR